MYLSAERLALANQTVRETFEQTSVAWQAIPHWDTGDPSQTAVSQDNLTPPINLLSLTPAHVVSFTLTLAEVVAPTADTLLANVIASTVQLAADFDTAVFPALLTGTTPKQVVGGITASDLLIALIAARAQVENNGYRAPSCLVTDTFGVMALAASTIANGYAGTDVLLPPANVNSLQRVDTLATDPDVRGWLLGRRQRIAPAGAADASAGEEAVDIAVSIPPSLEVVGEVAANTIELRVRIAYATRVKDEGGLVAFTV
ncbi:MULTISPECIES: hypothetical protein [Mycobacterium]|uniref:Phage major capsid protein n=1 Tax=Mycobacterium kiyosense TaxID=2871094 RepID=A0A9P3Q496_9MYCO|nr:MULTISPECIES: hypothetical protein [Mycobacterium]BDB43443.1 hypothetical protein IWGMT90018_38890 [Mycobacterium kiyosense]BDE13394.1 hypothetical protein MKCMC460_22540 [Mycobacterium sp. 20KCMC460]GLB86081.1 hypothetical protein SRL2020028_53370 [Mycobacterium kiyosense]GLB88327.1 hypothetical protein SRL2020130_11440 [Mycobacterium kiyosense]GLB94748.1 hypothetical protein SRL2020226_15240 [Mycobacterium kiyosense]